MTLLRIRTMKWLIPMLLSITGCIHEHDMLEERVRLLEIKQELADKELELTNARMQELTAELHKSK